MKNFLVICSTIIVMVGCCKFDDTALWNSIEDLDNRVEQLEELCDRINTNITSLQAIVRALETQDYITNVVSLPNDEGYIISFISGKNITIYHGHDGKDGQNGKDGVDGEAGVDGKTPVISVKQDNDGIYYWTVNGEWLIVDGHKVKAVGTDGKDGAYGEDGKDGVDGQDGITPQFKIENGYWFISYNNGNSWTQLGKAVGEDGNNGNDGQDGITPEFKIENGFWYVSYNEGSTWVQIGKATGENGQDGNDGSNGITPQFKIEDGYWFVSYDNSLTWEQAGKATGEDGVDGDSIFKNLYQDDDHVYFILSDDSIITLQKNNSEQILFNCDSDIYCIPGESAKISYEILSSNNDLRIVCIPVYGWSINVVKKTESSGEILLTSPATLQEEQIIILVSDENTTIMRTVNVHKGEINIDNHIHTVQYMANSKFIQINTNVEYDIEVQQETPWITNVQKDGSGILFSYSSNETDLLRSAKINIKNIDGTTIDAITIYQDSYKTKYIDINGSEIKMIFVEGGIFNGSTLEDYYISETEITEDLYSAVMTGVGNDKMIAKTGISYEYMMAAGGDSQNTWQNFISELISISNLNFSFAQGNYWLYAAKGGSHSKGYTYSGSNSKNEVVAPLPVGEVKRCKPNELGLYDMSGNLGEWGSIKNGYLYQFGGYGNSVEPIDTYLDYYNTNFPSGTYSEIGHQVSNRSGFRLMLLARYLDN